MSTARDLVKSLIGITELDQSEVIGYAYSISKSLIEKLQTDDFTDDELDQIQYQLDTFFDYLSQVNSTDFVTQTGVENFNVDQVSADCNIKIDEKREFNKLHPFIAYPPEYVFPRNPNLAQFLDAQLVENETYKEDGTGLRFEFGFAGALNIIRTKYPPYMDRVYFNFSAKSWAVPQIVFKIDGNENVVDVTPYFSNSVVNFSGNATGINDKIVYYFDGEKIVTNFDFSNVENRKKVRITYKKLLNSLRVKAVLKNNTPGLSFQTPVIDQYTLLVDKQRVLS
jgi:Asp-tRNA(Asn)/Glu-tRNA(Gln) amidotransferase C subunit